MCTFWGKNRWSSLEVDLYKRFFSFLNTEIVRLGDIPVIAVVLKVGRELCPPIASEVWFAFICLSVWCLFLYITESNFVLSTLEWSTCFCDICDESVSVEPLSGVSKKDVIPSQFQYWTSVRSIKSWPVPYIELWLSKSSLQDATPRQQVTSQFQLNVC